jgi:hypothetical protein
MLAQAHGYPGISPAGRSPVVLHLNASDGPAPRYGPSPAASSLLPGATLEFARSATAGRPVVTAAGRFLAPANRYFPRMHSPVAPDELVAAIKAEVTAGAAWVKIIGDAPEWGADGPRPNSTGAT